MGLALGERLLPLCGVSGSRVCEADSKAPDGCLVSESSLEMEGLEWCHSIALLRILLIASVRSGVGVYPTATEGGLLIGGWGIGTLETDRVLVRWSRSRL